MDPIAPQPQVQPVPARKISWGIVGIVLLLVGAGIGLAARPALDKYIEEARNEKELSSWLTFRVEEMGFELKYPPFLKDAEPPIADNRLNFLKCVRDPESSPMCFYTALRIDGDARELEPAFGTWVGKVYASEGNHSITFYKYYASGNHCSSTSYATTLSASEYFVLKTTGCEGQTPHNLDIQKVLETFKPVLIWSDNTASCSEGFVAVGKDRSVPPQEICTDNPASIFASRGEKLEWKTYRNEQYGFEFRYPAGWVLEEIDGRVELTKNNVVGALTISPKNVAKEFWFNKSTQVCDFEQALFVGKRAQMCNNASQNTLFTYYRITDLAQTNWEPNNEVGFNVEDILADEAEQILSTFKFTK